MTKKSSIMQFFMYMYICVCINDIIDNNDNNKNDNIYLNFAVHVTDIVISYFFINSFQFFFFN